jgi:hypothetical protein
VILDWETSERCDGPTWLSDASPKGSKLLLPHKEGLRGGSGISFGQRPPDCPSKQSRILHQETFRYESKENPMP